MATIRHREKHAFAGNVKLLDSDVLSFGIGEDVQVRWDGTDLDILAAADDSVIKFGNGTKSFDVWLYGDTASDYLLWDASANELSLNGGNKRVLGGLVYKNTAASSAVTNTVTETNFDTKYTIPANSLTAGTVVRARFQGIATSTNATDTLTIRGKLGSTVVFATTAVDVANDNIFAGEMTLIFRTVGASGTVVGSAMYNNPGAEGAAILTKSLASTSADTTAAITLAISAEWSVANVITHVGWM